VKARKKQKAKAARISAWRFLIMLPIGGPWKHSFSNGSED